MCQFKHYVEMSCFQRAQGGCPSPVLKVGLHVDYLKEEIEVANYL
jgi:hypothetical protein